MNIGIRILIFIVLILPVIAGILARAYDKNPQIFQEIKVGFYKELSLYSPIENILLLSVVFLIFVMYALVGIPTYLFWDRVYLNDLIGSNNLGHILLTSMSIFVTLLFFFRSAHIFQNLWESTAAKLFVLLVLPVLSLVAIIPMQAIILNELSHLTHTNPAVFFNTQSILSVSSNALALIVIFIIAIYLLSITYTLNLFISVIISKKIKVKLSRFFLALTIKYPIVRYLGGRGFARKLRPNRRGSEEASKFVFIIGFLFMFFYIALLFVNNIGRVPALIQDGFVYLNFSENQEVCSNFNTHGYDISFIDHKDILVFSPFSEPPFWTTTCDCIEKQK